MTDPALDRRRTARATAALAASGPSARFAFARRAFALATAAFVAGCAVAGSKAVAPAPTCLQDPARLAARSRELAEIAKQDQADRQGWDRKSASEMSRVAKNDEVRRRRVGEIFGEGCFSTPVDYQAAALVFQHGATPDHFFQAFIWSKRGTDLGDDSQKRMMALALDRYLVNVGRKQLFASQATKADLSSDSCWCLDPIERSFPDAQRKDVAGKTLEEAFAWLAELNVGRACPSAECSARRLPTPAGSVPGFW